MKNKLDNIHISKKDDNKKYFSILLVLLIGYFIINLLFLTKYPYVHSDESWLSGLSRTILDKQTFNTSEPFFDLYPRPIHGLKVVFVFLQILFIKIFGYSIFSVRLLSLMFGSLSLVLIFKILQTYEKNMVHSIIGTSIVAFNVQFIMSSHMARQEAIILFGMLLTYYLTIKNNFKYKHIVVASIIGILIGVHPNSFLVGCGIGLIYVYMYLTHEITLKNILSFIFTLIAWAMLFISFSLYLNPNFIHDYLAFGDSLGVINNSINRTQGFMYYYYKLFKQIGGTYYLVNIKFDILLLLALTVSGILITIKDIIKKSVLNNKVHNKILYPLLMLLGINIGYFIIGRYNQTAIIFTIVFTYIAFFEVISHYTDKLLSKKIITLVILVLFASYQANNTINEISETQYQNYNVLGERIKNSIPPDVNVLANLNLDYHFDNYHLYDFRNLAFLDENFYDYINRNEIEYIILYEEMEYIYNSKSKWNILYGELTYYEDLIEFLENDCTLVDEFENPTYGMRIAKYVDVYPWYTKIYKVKILYQ